MWENIEFSLWLHRERTHARLHADLLADLGMTRNSNPGCCDYYQRFTSRQG
jgi:hypothetical protein